MVGHSEFIDGVYCSTGTLSLSGSNVSGTVTLVAMGLVSIAGSNFTLQPYYQDVLLYSEEPGGAKALDIAGSGGTWEGYLYAPFGQAVVAGSTNFTIEGSIVAWTVQLPTSDFTITSNSSGGAAVLTLIE